MRGSSSSPNSLYHRLRVREVIAETHDSKSVIFDWPEDPQTRDAFSYRPGQFLTIRIPQPHQPIARCYSLASSPYTDPAMKVTVKRVAGGLGSNWICDQLSVGDEVEVLPPAGVFSPRTFDDDLLLCAGGSGITPVMSILKAALSQSQRRVVLLYANRDESSVIFGAELRELAAAHASRLQVLHWLESLQGRPCVAQLAELVRPYAGYQTFVCGPGPFMDAVATALGQVGVPNDKVHIEKFVSLDSDPGILRPLELGERDASAERQPHVSVELDGQIYEYAWPQDAVLLDVLLNEGLNAPFSCREGRCSACVCKLTEGEVTLKHNEVLDARDLSDGFILACQALPRSARLQISFDQQ